MPSGGVNIGFPVILLIACAFPADPDAWCTKVVYQVLSDRLASSNSVLGWVW
jgi:hypothetical protein